MTDKAGRLPPWRYRNDDEMLEDIGQGVLESEAERLCAALLAAEQAVRGLAPAILAELDANAAAYAEDRATWRADMASGDLPPDDGALRRASELQSEAGERMYEVLSNGRDQGTPAVQMLIDAMMNVYAFLDNIRAAELHDDLVECVAGLLGAAGPRYVLGY
jgi:hypothetical protein